MTTRVSARRGAPAPTVPTPAARRSPRAWRAATLALFDVPHAAVYSVELARVLECGVSTAAACLKRLELEGVLVSALEASPSSGNGRRVYRRRTP